MRWRVREGTTTVRRARGEAASPDAAGELGVAFLGAEAVFDMDVADEGEAVGPWPTRSCPSCW